MEKVVAQENNESKPDKDYKWYLAVKCNYKLNSKNKHATNETKESEPEKNSSSRRQYWHYINQVFKFGYCC